MHPDVQSDDPNAICTKCGTMKLVPREIIEHPTEIISVKRKLKDFLPIIVIFSIIILFTTLMILFVRSDFAFGMRMFMGSFFAIFGFFKVINLRKFVDAYQTYDIVAKRSRFYAYLYPFLELLFAVTYLFDLGGITRDILVFIIMTVSALGVVQKLRLKEEIPCACLGMVFILPMTWVTLIEDLLMAVEAMIMIVLFIS
jgi:hypothetical protein